jgi:MFS family permease
MKGFYYAQGSDEMHNLRKFYIPLILIFIISDVIGGNYIFGSFNNEPLTLEFFLFMGLLILQIIASPVQSGLSDFYGRKKSLIISLSASLLALVFVLFQAKSMLFFIPILLLKGLLGNTIPISWAAIGDTIGETSGKNYRFTFALSTSAYAVGYLFLIFINKSFTTTHSIMVLIALLSIVVYLCYKFFIDTKDAECDASNNSQVSLFKFAAKEFSLVIHDLKISKFRLLLTAFCLWEISLYTILIYFADFRNYEASLTEVAMMIGYLIGTFLVRFCKRISDNLMIKYGYKISLISVIPYLILLPFFNDTHLILGICFFFHAIGNAFLSPTILSIVSNEKEPHERGKIYGLLESADNLAFLLASIAIFICNKFHSGLPYLVTLSFLTMAVSWFPYAKFEKIKRKGNSA